MTKRLSAYGADLRASVGRLVLEREVASVFDEVSRRVGSTNLVRSA